MLWAFDTLPNGVLPQLCWLICSLGPISPPPSSPFSIINQITPTKLSFSCVIEIVFFFSSLLSSQAFLERVSSCCLSLLVKAKLRRVKSGGLVIQKRWHQVNDLIFSIKIKKLSPTRPAGQRRTSKAPLRLIVFVLKNKISKEFTRVGVAVRVDAWPRSYPSISWWYAIYTSAPSSPSDKLALT